MALAIDLPLTVLDNLDGTVTASAVGGAGSAGATFGLYRAAWNTQAGGTAAWTLAGTAVANGAGTASWTALATTPGFYLWLAARLPTGTTADWLSGAVYRPVVDLTLAVHDRILSTVVTMIRSLNLSGIGSAANKVFRRWYPVYLDGIDAAAVGGGGLPLVMVSPYPKEVPLGHLTGRDDVGYPVLVAYFDALPAGLADTNMGRVLKWRRQVAALFRAQQLAGVPEVVLTQWQPDVIASDGWMKDTYVAGAHVFIFRSRESRGLVS